MNAREALLAAARERILITDGAFGTEIQGWKLSEADYAGSLGLAKDQKGNNDILALTKPEVPAAIHRAYFEAGADIAETNTFSANRISQADYGAEHLVADINHQSARLGREAADKYEAMDGRRRFIAGAVGPTNKTLSLSPDVNNPGYREIDFDELKNVYLDQVVALAEGGADFILIETIFDTTDIFQDFLIEWPPLQHVAEPFATFGKIQKSTIDAHSLLPQHKIRHLSTHEPRIIRRIRHRVHHFADSVFTLPAVGAWISNNLIQQRLQQLHLVLCVGIVRRPLVTPNPLHGICHRYHVITHQRPRPRQNRPKLIA